MLSPGHMMKSPCFPVQRETKSMSIALTWQASIGCGVAHPENTNTANNSLTQIL